MGRQRGYVCWETLTSGTETSYISSSTQPRHGESTDKRSHNTPAMTTTTSSNPYTGETALKPAGKKFVC